MNDASVPWVRRALASNSGVLIAALVFAVLLGTVAGINTGPLTYFDISFMSSGGATSALAAIGQTLVILSGGFDHASLKSFLEELFHEDHGFRRTNAVVLGPQPPDRRVRALLNGDVNAKRSRYIQGSPMDAQVGGARALGGWMDGWGGSGGGGGGACLVGWWLVVPRWRCQLCWRHRAPGGGRWDAGRNKAGGGGRGPATG